MENLVLSAENARKLCNILVMTICVQNMIMDAVKNRQFDPDEYEFAVKRFESKIAQHKRFFSKFASVEVPSDQYVEGRLNAYRMALGV